MAIVFKQRVNNPTMKDLGSFVRKTVTRDRDQYTDSQWDNETTFINRQREQLKTAFGYMWDMEDEPLIRGQFGNITITDSEISFKPRRYAPTEIYVAAKWYCMATQSKFNQQIEHNKTRARLA